MDKNKNNPTEAGQPGFGEFIALMAFTTSLVALSIDAMLPAFPEMARDLQVQSANDIQLVISLLFIGFAVGQLFYGPLSDSIGRKPAMYLGFLLFILGSLLSLFAADFYLMLAGRFLQGLGAAGPRTVAIALIRDKFHGSEMARVMSFIMTIFILVPMIAPALGQAILRVAGWRSIFGVLALLAVMSSVWLGMRQPETLPKRQRRPFSLKSVRVAVLEVTRHRVTVMYTLVAACVFSAFLGYLNTSQQIFQVQYGLGNMFPVYFAILALAVGCASLVNSGMVMRFGMHVLTHWALRLMMLLTWLFLFVVWLNDGHPALWLFMAVCMATFFFMGVLFGNLNSIAMEPMGHIAGTAAAAIGSASTLLSVPIGMLIGRSYDGTLIPMATGFAVLITISVLITETTRRKRAAVPDDH